MTREWSDLTEGERAEIQLAYAVMEEPASDLFADDTINPRDGWTNPMLAEHGPGCRALLAGEGPRGGETMPMQ